MDSVWAQNIPTRKTATFFSRRAGFRVTTIRPWNRENASHFALVFTLVCRQSGKFGICCHVSRRLNICSRARIGVFCNSVLFLF